MRGFACVGLQNPKNPINVGSVLRICGNFDVNLLAISGIRYHKVATDTMKAYRHFPLLQVDDLHTVIPFDCIPIAVDILPEAKSIFTFTHPERAFYIFGPEDGTLGKKVLNWCKYKIFIPTKVCMNLAISVGIVLYDRLSKETGE